MKFRLRSVERLIRAALLARRITKTANPILEETLDQQAVEVQPGRAPANARRLRAGQAAAYHARQVILFREGEACLVQDMDPCSRWVTAIRRARSFEPRPSTRVQVGLHICGGLKYFARSGSRNTTSLHQNPGLCRRSRTEETLTRCRSSIWRWNDLVSNSKQKDRAAKGSELHR